jgi:N-acetylglutamate synthase-like GNAT family acetyltransferase
VNLRVATAEDRESLQRLINQAFVVERPIKKGGGDRLDSNGHELDELLSRGTFLVLDKDGSLSGCVYLQPDGESCYLGLLSVSPERQGGGLARQLALASESFAKARGCRRIHLRVVSPRRDELVPLYLKLGYSEVGQQDYPPDLAAEMRAPGHFIRMAKEL